ncbi:hypothetical protein K3N28_16590 [Glycomyces sp. TRM65418]|uniref:hypothetical protein n=1 Tax=Glycomyces sp. TRM65418 TaxID=2867006 RepID=UPI001CE55F73|nr:hypothetical protein [Glycomyces sp. TRM65418]MCC3764677.1 hypothetical protein [Glycomyces sp. TRM65418]QZD54337.1 hypothetical protein K3N28_16505 [Glycomyces sp. TRM65418]
MTDDLFTTGDEAWSTADVTPEPPTFEFTIAFGDASALDSGARAGCSGACPHPVAHPAEEDWVHLVSAVPVEGQRDRFTPRCEGMAYPTEADFRAAVGAVRPEDADAFSSQRLRSGWTDEVASVAGTWPERLKSKLAALSEGWAGEDFDAFAAQADQARALVEGALDDIEATVAELERRETAIYTLQGGDSGEIPYPAPMVGIEGEWSNLVALHVRPAWWHGECITMTCEEAEKALELAGADTGLATEVREFIEERVGANLLGLGSPVSDVRALAGEEAREVFTDRVGAELAAYVERRAAIDEAIAEKRAGQSEELAAVRTTSEVRPYPSSADVSHMDMMAPEAERPAAPVAPRTTENPSPVPPGGDGSASETGASTTDESPWDDAEDDDGATSGGLASGGPGSGGPGGTGGSFGSGGGTGRVGGVTTPGGTVPQGLFGPAVTGATPGTAASTSGTSGTRTGTVQGPQGGAPGRSGKAPANTGDDEKDGEAKPDGPARRETGNVWGYVKPNEDPYN